jgi:FOG: Ankyrin repeat
MKNVYKKTLVLFAASLICLSACSKRAQQQQTENTAAGQQQTFGNFNSDDFVNAVKTQSPTVIAKYIKSGANVNAKQGGLTVLEAAIQYNKDPEVAKLLIQHGADFKIKDKSNANLLTKYATNMNSPLFVRYLVTAGLNPNEKDNIGRTPIISAAPTNQNVTVFLELISSGADVNARTNDGWSALDYAVRGNKNPEVLKVLLKYGAHPKDIQNAKELNAFIKYNRILAGKGYEKLINDSLADIQR